MKARVTVEFTHEVDGKRVSDTMEMLLSYGDRKAYSDGAFKSRAKGRLEQELKLVNVEVIRATLRMEPPMIEL